MKNKDATKILTNQTLITAKTVKILLTINLQGLADSGRDCAAPHKVPAKKHSIPSEYNTNPLLANSRAELLRNQHPEERIKNGINPR